jgi:hypothetical protein
MTAFPIDMLTVPVGVIILILGRKLFWLFVAGIGFIFGIHIAAGALYGHPTWIVVLIGLVAGIGGAVVAVFLQRFAVILAGFMAGSYLAANLTAMWAWQIGPFLWMVMVIFGILGAAAAYLFFDWALIILSALTGAAVITDNLTLGATGSTILMALLFTIGIVVQFGLLQRDRARSSVHNTRGA